MTTMSSSIAGPGITSLREKQIAAIHSILNLHKGTPPARAPGSSGPGGAPAGNSLLAYSAAATGPGNTAAVGSGGPGSPQSPGPEDGITWKVLVYDLNGRDIIAPLFPLPKMRALGITLHLNLHSERFHVPDAPAIYLVSPTAENIDRIARDLSLGLYQSFHLCFLSPVSRDLLERLAAACVASDAAALIAQVTDEYLDFVALEDRLFSLRQEATLVDLHSPGKTEEQIMAVVDRVAGSLFSVCVTLGQVPIIRAPMGQAAEHIARRLQERIHQSVSSQRGNLFSGASAAGSGLLGSPSLSRPPVLIVLDRLCDLSTPMRYSWTYQVMLHDILNMKLNKVTLTNANSERKAYFIDPSAGFFRDNARLDFSDVARNVDAALTDYRVRYEQITQIGSAASAQAGAIQFEQIPTHKESADRLLSAMSELPELTRKKETIDAHMTLGTELLGHIKARSLDAFVKADPASLNVGSLLAIIRDISKGTPADKTRLAFLFLDAMLMEEIRASASAGGGGGGGVGVGGGGGAGTGPGAAGPGSQPFSQHLPEVLEALRQGGCDTAPVEYLQLSRSLHLMSRLPGAGMAGSGGGAGGGGGPGGRIFPSQLVDSLSANWSQLAGDTAVGSMLRQGAKSLLSILPGQQATPLVTRVVEEVLNGAPSTSVGNLLWLDPRSRRREAQAPVGREAAFDEAIVCVIGGGSYLEYLSLCDLESRTPGRKIYYGATELLTPADLLGQLGTLAQVSASPSASPGLATQQ